MGFISDLLRYKKEVTLKEPRTGEALAKVWVKVLGDEAIKEAYKYSRVMSSDIRERLANPETLEYKTHIKSLDDQVDKDLYDLILAAKVNDFTRESVAVIAREELPKLEEISVEPDAPTLKEQEQLDKEERETEKRFMDAINKYVDERKVELEADLKKAKRPKLLEMAKEQMTNLIPTQAFLQELDEQKGYRGTFKDKECKTKAFDSIEEYRDTHSSIKEQILQAYNEVELGADEIKN